MTARATPATQRYLKAAQPRRSAHWRDTRFMVVDLETTGLRPDADEIISFAALEVRQGRVRLDDAHHTLVRPKSMPRPDTVRIHGLREQDLLAAPTLDEVLDGWLDVLAGGVLVAHAAWVEQSFLSHALAQRGLPWRGRTVDTMALGQAWLRLRGQAVPATIGLSELAVRLGLPVHRPHHADGDALTTAQLFVVLASHLEEAGRSTVGDLLHEARSGARRSRRPSLVRHGRPGGRASP